MEITIRTRDRSVDRFFQVNEPILIKNEEMTRLRDEQMRAALKIAQYCPITASDIRTGYIKMTIQRIGAKVCICILLAGVCF